MKQKYQCLFLLVIILFSHYVTQAQFLSFEHDGINREYIYYEPAELNDNRPLVFVLHGFGGNGPNMSQFTGMEEIADQYGFAICYPNGSSDSGGRPFWNVGYAFHTNETVDDVGFLTELAGHLQSTHNLNPENTFATGFSNGAEMCYMLACQSPNTFKAVAPVAGAIIQGILQACDNSTPIPLLEIHSTGDDVIPIEADPNNSLGWGVYPLSIPETVEYFADKNQYTSIETETLTNIDPFHGNFVNTTKYQNGVNNNEVWYYEIDGGFHGWPRNSFGTNDINVGEEAWLFFQNHINNVNSTLSLTDIEELENTIQVFPNPASNIITIETNNTMEINEIMLYNTLGVNLNLKSTNGLLDIAHLSKGVYLLNIKTSKGALTKTIVKN